MRYEINVTWITERTAPAFNPRSVAPIRRPAPTFLIDAKDDEDARSKVSSILGFATNVEVGVAPASEGENS